MLKIISWNIARRDDAWRRLLDTDADIALLQEAAPPPKDVAQIIEVDSAPWRTAGAGLRRNWRTAVVKLSNRADVQWLESKTVEDAQPRELVVSRPGTLAAAIVTVPDVPPLFVASMYAPWERPHATTGSSWIYADASVHRLISDLSVFIGQQSGHRIIAAGDLNTLYGYGEHGSSYLASRHATVFNRMTALGLNFMGPQAPNGRQADPWPDELPKDSKNVPTYYTNRQNPTTATRQLDFVFTSGILAKCVKVKALNDPQNWGSSDHCRIEIEVDYVK